jgi:hypothetical protein
MIVYELSCRPGGHRFEGWFGSSADFDEQQARGLVDCPECGSSVIEKAPMAPNLARKGNQIDGPTEGRRSAPAPAAEPSAGAPVAGGTLPPQAVAAMRAMAAMQAEALKDSRWVGESFAEVSRQIHYGERDAESIHGEATADEARELLDEGIDLLPLPFPVAPPGEAN